MNIYGGSVYHEGRSVRVERHKARTNLAEHEVSFEAARLVFDDPHNLEIIDDRFDYGEDRYNAIGMVKGELLTVSYTERGNRIRFISARKATHREQINYFRQEL